MGTATAPPAVLAGGFAVAAIFLFAMDGDDDAAECAMPLMDVPIGDGFFAFIPGVGIATAVAGDMFPRSAHRGRRCERGDAAAHPSQLYRNGLAIRSIREH